MTRTPRVVVGVVAVFAVLIAGGYRFVSRASAAPQQDVISILIKKGEPLRLAVADFRVNSPEIAPFVRVFNDVVWADLDNSGLFQLVSKSMYPQALPGRREELLGPGALAGWSGPPANAQMLAFGNATSINGQLVIEGYLWDVASQQPEILARRYIDQPSEAAARVIAHRFANAIIERLGGGIAGIAESKIYFVRSNNARTKDAVKEVWMMDYDGANQMPLTHYHSLALTPSVSQDGERLAFTSYSAGPPQIFIFSLASMRRLQFSNPQGTLNTTPAWSPDGKRIVFSSSVTGDPEIYVANADGSGMRRLTVSRGVDISPVWNPRGGSIAFVSDRSGVPQVYVMDEVGANVRRLTEGGGDAVTPAWAPNGQVLTFSWTRGFAPGNYNIFIMDVASGRLEQLTHGAGRNEHPWFSPDGRHLVFDSNRSGIKQVFTMLADGTKVRALTSAGENTSPVWSAR